MTGSVLVTGGFGLVGSETVKRLIADGRQVVVADLDTRANRKKAGALPDGVATRWADLTDAEAVKRLVSEVSPSVIVHLAAVIPPPLYRNPGLARKVNVDATKALVRAAEAQPNPPRFVQASSNAVYGSRNPHRVTDVVRADTPPRPFELYSNTKFEAEQYVRASSLEWVVLRLGGVLSPNFSALPLTADGIFIESALPTDGRIHTVDVRDVGAAFAAATTADVAGEILLIGGDDSHKLLQKDVGPALAARPRAPRRAARGTAGRPQRRRRLVPHRLDGHREGAGGTGISAAFVAGHARRDERANGVEALSAAPRRTAGAGVSRTPRRIPQCPRYTMPICGARSQPGWAIPAWTRSDRPASRGPTGSHRSAGCGATRWRPGFRRRRGSSAR